MTQTGRKATLPKLGSSFTGSTEHFVIHYTDMTQSLLSYSESSRYPPDYTKDQVFKD